MRINSKVSSFFTSRKDGIPARLSALVPAWYREVVLFPFAVTRLIYLVIAWFGIYFPLNNFDPQAVSRGWFLSPHYWLDIWARWDSQWYFSIVTGGYHPSSNLTGTASNLAFFPLYPYLVRSVQYIFPQAQKLQSIYLVVGLLISNVSFLIAAGLLYRLILDHIAGEKVARISLLLLFAFPTSFIFSCFYTESLFLVLSLASITLALKRRWFSASLLGALSALSRPQGILVIIPLVWIYFRECGWQFKRLKLDLAWQVMIPGSVALFFISLYPITGSYWAPLLVQKAYGRGAGLVENTIGLLQTPYAKMKQMDIVMWGIFLVVVLVGMWRLPSRVWGVYALAQILAPVPTGSLYSFTRFGLVIFPFYIILATLMEGRRRWLILIAALFFAMQVVDFLGWVDLYWIA